MYLYLTITKGELYVILVPVIVETYPVLKLVAFVFVVNVLYVEGTPTFMVNCPLFVKGAVSIYLKLSNSNI